MSVALGVFRPKGRIAALATPLASVIFQLFRVRQSKESLGRIQIAVNHALIDCMAGHHCEPCLSKGAAERISERFFIGFEQVERDGFEIVGHHYRGLWQELEGRLAQRDGPTIRNATYVAVVRAIEFGRAFVEILTAPPNSGACDQDGVSLDPIFRAGEVAEWLKARPC